MHIPAGLTAERHRRTWRLAAVSAVAGLVATAGAVALAGPWDAGQRVAERAVAAPHGGGGAGGAADAPDDDATGDGPLAPTAEHVLPPLGGAGGASPPAPVDAAGLTADLAPLLDDPALGDRVAGAVVDVTTGEELLTLDADRSLPPASTVKLVTAHGALRALGPDHRLTTRTVFDAEHERVVLVGGSDPTVTDEDLRELAEETAEALRQRGVDQVGVGYDAEAFSDGQAQHPIGVNNNIAPLSSLMVNGGRLDDSTHGPAPRSADPAGDAAEEFVRALGAADIEVRGSSAAERTAPPGAERLASHDSAPVGELVERMLTESDNDLAEALGRHVALIEGEEPDLAGVATALTTLLDDAGVPLDGVRVRDASGLDRDGRLTAAALVRLLTLAADPEQPELRPMLTGLPVGGFSGTLSGRYQDGGAGLVRAKTGTLTGVNALAGTAVQPADGRVLVFAFLTLGGTAPEETEAALDRAAAALTGG